jgi:uncharacterized protein YdeI (BOF family)
LQPTGPAFEIGKSFATSLSERNIIGGLTMKNFLLYFSVATAVCVLTLSLALSSHAQQADQDQAPTMTQKPQQNEAQVPFSGDTTTHEAKAFSGRIVEENGEVVLKDPVAKISYKLSDPEKAKQYVGKQVKVTGKLDIDSNTIAVDSIELLS